jgi:hypothetical protein
MTKASATQQAIHNAASHWGWSRSTEGARTVYTRGSTALVIAWSPQGRVSWTDVRQNGTGVRLLAGRGKLAQTLAELAA